MIFPGTPGRFSDCNHALCSNVGKGPKGDGIIADVVRDDPYGVYRIQFKNSKTGEVYLTTPNMDPGSRIYFCTEELTYEFDNSYTVPFSVFSPQQVGTIRDARVGDIVFYKLHKAETSGTNAIGIGIITNISLQDQVTFMQHAVLDVGNIDEIDARVQEIQRIVEALPDYSEFVTMRTELDEVHTELDEKPFVFDTVTDMQECAFLTAGTICETKGYHTLNDLGGACYKVVASIQEGAYYETLNNGLYAIPIFLSAYVTPEMFGAYGDGIHDDTEAFQSAINTNKTIVCHESKTYKITSVEWDNDCIVYGNGATILPTLNSETGRKYPTFVFNAQYVEINDFSFVQTWNAISSNVTDNALITHTNGKNISINNCHFKNVRTGISEPTSPYIKDRVPALIHIVDVNETHISNCVFDNCNGEECILVMGLTKSRDDIVLYYGYNKTINTTATSFTFIGGLAKSYNNVFVQPSVGSVENIFALHSIIDSDYVKLDAGYNVYDNSEEGRFLGKSFTVCNTVIECTDATDMKPFMVYANKINIDACYFNGFRELLVQRIYASPNNDINEHPYIAVSSLLYSKSSITNSEIISSIISSDNAYTVELQRGVGGKWGVNISGCNIKTVGALFLTNLSDIRLSNNNIECDCIVNLNTTNIFRTLYINNCTLNMLSNYIIYNEDASHVGNVCRVYSCYSATPLSLSVNPYGNWLSGQVNNTQIS